MAIEEINAAGGVLGRRLELLTEDTQCKAGEPATVVNKLITREGVVAVLGEVASSRSLEAAPICQQNRIPMISPSSTNPDVTRTGDYIFRVCFIDPFQGTVMANFASKTLKLKRVAIFTDVKSDYSKGLARFFKERFVANGGEIVVELDFNGGDKDFKAQLTTIKAANPDGVFVPGYYTECALISVQAKQLGLTVPLFGGDGWESEKLFEIGGQAVEGNYLSTHYHPAVGTELSRKFVDNYRKRWNGKTPDALAACGYDSALILADAIKRAGTTESAKLRDAIAATRNFPAVTGTITINESRDATKPAVILEVKGGKYEYLETVEP
jgi:branched-chain amino acid transport system substrate-binding protein